MSKKLECRNIPKDAQAKQHQGALLCYCTASLLSSVTPL